MRYLTVFIFCLQAYFANAQSGSYFLSHYSPSDDRLDNVCFQMVQTETGLTYFATRSGVFEFDGRNWNLLKGNGAIYSLALTPGNRLYWGGATGFGIIKNNQKALPEIITLSTGVKNVFQNLNIGETLYFINDEKVFIVNEKHEITSIAATNLTGAFDGIFNISGSVYVNTSKGDRYKIDEDKLTLAEIPFPDKTQIIFTQAGKDFTLAGLTNNKVYLIGKSLKPREIILEDQDYVTRSAIVTGNWVNDELLVIGTLRGGLIFVNALTGETQQIINYSTGLPDNEVYTLMRDKSLGIWAAHEYGFTRIVPHLPFRSFSHYPGLQGNLLCAISFNNKVYVGTSLGLFKLQSEDVFEEVTYFADEPVSVKRSLDKPPEEAESPDTQMLPQAESKKKGIFGFLKKKKAVDEGVTDEILPTQEKAITQATKSFSIQGKKRKTEKVLRTARYVYKKVAGIEAKVTQLVEVNNQLIAAGLGGTFIVENTKATTLSDVPARYIYGTKNNLLLISTYADAMKTFDLNSKKRQPVDLLRNLNDQITYVFEDAEDALWLCGLDKVYRLNYNDEQVKNIQVIEINNPNYDEFVGLVWRSQTLLANAQGFFSYQPGKKEFVSVDSLSQNSLINYFAHQNAIWYRDLHGWNLFGNISAQTNLGFLNLYQTLRYVSPDEEDGNLWIITGNNELFRFYGDRVVPFDAGFPITLRSYTNNNVKHGEHFDVKIDQENSSLKFEFIQPDYLASLSIEYRTHLEGLEQSWTTWSSSNNVVDYPYLPAGDYVIQVQARDILGRIKDMPPIKIEVLPPYWHTPWFYAIEVFVLVCLVLLSFRLSARYRIVSRLLMLLTIIMLIQFIETVVGETFETRASPVIDFFIQVIIAMLVLPVEGYLREMMLKSLEKNHPLTRIILQKQESAIVKAQDE